jgi:hypothetical protein
MRRATIGMLGLGMLVLAGCGGGAHFADKSRPPTPVNVSVYINDARVSVSPTSVGAGPVVFIITNQASRAEAVAVRPTSGGATLASTAPINPQATSQVSVNFRQGEYTLSTSSNDAGAISGDSTSLHVGPPRQNSNNALLEP